MTEKKTKTKQNFEDALARLEAIVADMEGGELSIEKMMKYFEEGQGLIAFCSKKLNEVERKIEILVRKGDKVVAEPFEESDVSEPVEATGEEGGDAPPGELF
jgi:exodeoxyribonuclease VII small subunit